MAHTYSLFSEARHLEHIQLLDADLHFNAHFLTTAAAEELFQELCENTPWKHEQILIAGMRRYQPRLTAWYGDPEARYQYSGLMMQPLPWTPALLKIKADIEDLTQTKFNSVLLNCYRDQHDGMGWHSDDEKELGAQPVIASLSLGATRRFALKHKTERDKRYQLLLNHGSLLVMAGSTQSHWLHSVAKQTAETGARINLTFRTIYSNQK